MSDSCQACLTGPVFEFGSSFRDGRFTIEGIDFTMGSNSTNAPVIPNAIRAAAQPVTALLTRAAIFLVVTVKPGPGHRGTIRSFCGNLASLVRAVGSRDLEGGLSCVMGFGSDAWDRLFGAPRPAELHPFREFRAGARH